MPGAQAAITIARLPGGSRVDRVQVAEHGFHRGLEAVHIQAAEAHAIIPGPIGVERPQMRDKAQDLRIAPHPCRKTREGIARERGLAAVDHEAVEMSRIRPVRFDRHDTKVVVLDQVLGDGGAGTVKLGRPVRRLAEQDDPGIPEAIEAGAEASLLGQWQGLGVPAQEFDEAVAVCGGCHGVISLNGVRRRKSARGSQLKKRANAIATISDGTTCPPLNGRYATS